MTPHGDRRDGSQSGSIETQIYGAEREHHVVRVLVLSHDLRDVNNWRLRESPSHQVGERMTATEGSTNFSNNRWVDRVDWAHGNRPHIESYDLCAALCQG